MSHTLATDRLGHWVSNISTFPGPVADIAMMADVMADLVPAQKIYRAWIDVAKTSGLHDASDDGWVAAIVRPALSIQGHPNHQNERWNNDSKDALHKHKSTFSSPI